MNEISNKNWPKLNMKVEYICLINCPFLALVLSQWIPALPPHTHTRAHTLSQVVDYWLSYSCTMKDCSCIMHSQCNKMTENNFC